MPSIAEPTKTNEIFFSYSHKDQRYRDHLETQLSLLKREGLISNWYDRKIEAGEEWVGKIDEHLNAAQIILLLISPDFIASDYCYDIEMTRALERHEAREAHVIPIILRPVDWHSAPFGKLQALPTNAKPITSWNNRDEAYLDVVIGIRRVLGGLKTSSISLQPTTASFWVVPFRRNPFFTGREDILNHLHEMLRVGVIALAQTQAISGLGGIGKTQIAIEYAYRHRNDYQIVLWVRADSYETLIADFITISHKLNLGSKEIDEKFTAIEALNDWLESHRNWLLIFDNADDLEAIHDFLPKEGNGHVLLTTRAQATGSIANRIEVEKMTLEQGALFLLRRAKIIAPEARLDQASETDITKAKEISKLMDGLALALDQAGAYIEETNCDLSEYPNLYQQQRKTLLLRRSRFPIDHPQSVATTFSLCFQKVEKANPAAADLMRLCAFLPYPDMIEERFLRRQILNGRYGLFGRTSQSSTLRGLATDPLNWNAAVAELLNYSLIQRNPSTKVLTTHRLVQVVLKDGMNRQIKRLWTKRVNGYDKYIFASLLNKYIEVAGFRFDDQGDRFSKITRQFKKVLSLSQQEAERLQHEYIGTEHLLLGLVREGECIAARVLISLGVELNKIRSEVEFIIGRGNRAITDDNEISLTPLAKKVILLAVEEARNMEHQYVTTEHLLLAIVRTETSFGARILVMLGMVRKGKGVGTRVLERLGIDRDKVLTQMNQMLSQSEMSDILSSQTHNVQKIKDAN